MTSFERCYWQLLDGCSKHRRKHRQASCVDQVLTMMQAPIACQAGVQCICSLWHLASLLYMLCILVNPWSTLGGVGYCCARKPCTTPCMAMATTCFKAAQACHHPGPKGVLRLPTCRAGDLKLSFVPTCRISRRYRMNSRRLNWFGTGSRIQVCRHQKTALMTTNGMV
jgi:hypothetical protein